MTKAKAMTDLNKLNGNGTPLHACNGYIQDAHYWVWLNTPSFEYFMRNVRGAHRLGETPAQIAQALLVAKP